MKKLLIITFCLIIGILFFRISLSVRAEECAECETGAISEQEVSPNTIDSNSSLYQRFTFTLPGGYVARGVGMRNRGYGNITISGIPSNSEIEAAFLYWDILDNQEYESFKQGKFNGVSITGIKIGEGPDPCWAPTKNFAYRADVNSLVTGNGIYSLTDFASGRRDGYDPWFNQYPFPQIEGASLVVIYRNPASPWQTIVIYDGAQTLIATEYTHAITGFTASSPVTNASITYLGADGQNSKSAEDTYFNGVRIGNYNWNGGDLQSGPNYSRGNLWDTNTYDVTSLVSSGDTSATAKVRSYYGPNADCLVWVATVFSVSVVPPGRIFPDKAVGLAKEVIDAPYHLKMYEPSTKGFIWEKDKGYYFFTSEQVKNGYPGKKPGLDCSGLSFWSYNRAYYGDGHEEDPEKNFPVMWEGANGQYRYNTDPIKKEELKPGDLLFLGDNVMMNHVAMYIGGPFEFKYKKDGEDKVFMYNSVEATIWGDEIITVAFYSAATETLTTLQPSTGKTRFLTVDGYGRMKDAKAPEFKSVAKSPVNLIVIDPDGEIINKEIGQSLMMEYQVYDIDGDGELDDIVIGGERKIGDYLIQVVPEPDALPTDTYSLEITANGQTIILADEVSISDIPRTPYIIRSTETEIIPVIPAFVDFDPDTLNLKSKGKWVTSYIELPIGSDINIIDLESIRLNNQIAIESKPTEISDYDKNGIPDLMVKFDRLAVQSILEVGEEVKMIISGELINGKPFEGTDIIRVISEGKK